jgi:hypothetical protein
MNLIFIITSMNFMVLTGLETKNDCASEDQR